MNILRNSCPKTKRAILKTMKRFYNQGLQEFFLLSFRNIMDGGRKKLLLFMTIPQRVIAMPVEKSFCYQVCVKSVQIQSYFLSVFSCIQSEYRRILTRNYSVFGHFSSSEVEYLSHSRKYDLTYYQQLLRIVRELGKSSKTKRWKQMTVIF